MDERKAMGPDGTEGPRRNGSGHFSGEERERLSHEAVMLRAEGKTYREIAKALGISKNTVSPLLAEEYDRRKAGRDEARATAISRYESIIRECSRRIKAFADNSSAQNVSGLMAQKRSAQERIDKITGVEAPVKSEHRRETIDLTKVLEPEDLDTMVGVFEKYPNLWDRMLDGEER